MESNEKIFGSPEIVTIEKCTPSIHIPSAIKVFRDKVVSNEYKLSEYEIKKLEESLKEKPNIFKQIIVYLDGSKRNIGAVLLGTGQTLSISGATQAASIVTPIGWVLLGIGVIHAIIKKDVDKDINNKETTIDEIIILIVKLCNSLKKIFKKGD
jgi:hypothetical protein